MPLSNAVLSFAVYAKQKKSKRICRLYIVWTIMIIINENWTLDCYSEILNVIIHHFGHKKRMLFLSKDIMTTPVFIRCIAYVCSSEYLSFPFIAGRNSMCSSLHSFALQSFIHYQTS